VHDYLLGTTELGKVALAHVGGRDSIDSFAELIGEVRARCGDSVASLFAEPVRSPARPGKPPVVTWYAAFEGPAVALGQLDPAEQARVKGLTRACCASGSRVSPACSAIPPADRSSRHGFMSSTPARSSASPANPC
jgi:hypothetical protein